MPSRCLSRRDPAPEHHTKLGRSHLVGRDFAGYTPGLNHDEAACEREELAEIDRDHDHRRAAGCGKAQFLMHRRGRGEVQSARRVAAQNDLGISRQFARKNKLSAGCRRTKWQRARRRQRR